MTTPGGVPNLPVGALTVDTLGEKLQDMSPTAMRGRAGERMPGIFNSSSGGSPLSDLSPFGILNRIWAEFNSAVANADPADINGPEDLPGLLLDFIKELPVIGELVGLLEAIVGEYDGDDEVLLAIQQIFMPLRRLVQLVAGKDVGFPSLEEVVDGWEDLGEAIVSGGIQLIRGVIPAHLLPPIHIGRLTEELPPLVADGGFDVAPDGDSGDGWFHDPAVGRTKLGASGVVGSGELVQLLTQPVAVAKGQTYRIGGFGACEGAVGAADCVQLQVLEYGAEGDEPINTVTVASWTPSGTVGWTEFFGSYTVPEGVAMVGVTPAVTAGFTAGTVWLDDITSPSTGLIEQSWVQDLLGDLQSLFNWIGSLVDNLLAALGITPTGGLMDRIFDLSDELEWLKARGEDVGDLIQNLLTNPGAVIGTIGQDMVSGLESTLNQIEDVFNGLVVTPVNSVVGAISDWFNTWFGGGSSNAIPLSMRGAANGVAPLNSSTKLATSYLETNVANGVPQLNGSGLVPANRIATLPYLPTSTSLDFVPTGDKGAADGVAPLDGDTTIPLIYLPSEVGGGGGPGTGRPYVILSLASSQSIPNNNATSLAGFEQSGTAGVTFTDGTNQMWTFNQPGWWDIELYSGWATGTTGVRQLRLRRSMETTANGGGLWTPVRVPFIIDEKAASTSSGAPGHSLRTMQRVADFQTSLPAAPNTIWRFSDEDDFSVQAFHTQGSSLNVLGGSPYPFGTYLICTYLGSA